MSCNPRVNGTLRVNITVVDCKKVALDISTATNFAVRLRGPTTVIDKSGDGTTGDVLFDSDNGTGDGTDGKIYVIADANEVNETGLWNVQTTATFPGSPAVVHPTSIGRFTVDGNL